MVLASPLALYLSKSHADVVIYDTKKSKILRKVEKFFKKLRDGVLLPIFVSQLTKISAIFLRNSIFFMGNMCFGVEVEKKRKIGIL